MDRSEEIGRALGRWTAEHTPEKYADVVAVAYLIVIALCGMFLLAVGAFALYELGQIIMDSGGA